MTEGPPPNPVTVLARHIEYYACGCTTTREERILLPVPDPRRCGTHGDPLSRIAHSTEFHSTPVKEDWQLRPAD